MTTSAREQSARLASLLRNERAALAEFLIALSDFDRRRLWVDLGHASLFSFLTRDLGLSAGAAFYRKTAAELLQNFPEVIEPLRDGRLCFTSIVELSKNLTRENRDRILPRFFHVSKREAQAITAELQPAEVVPRRVVVTPVRSPVSAAPALALRPVTHVPGTDRDEVAPFHPGETVHANSERPPQEGPLPLTAPRMTVEPKTADESRLHITVPRSLLRKLDQARAALSHSHPGATEDVVLEVGLDLVLERTAKRRGLVKKPRSAPSPRPAGEREAPPARTRYVPAAVRRAVWLRDEGKCQWKLDSGGTCGSTLRAEVDHVDGLARGAGASVDELRILCRTHQDLSVRNSTETS